MYLLKMRNMVNTVLRNLIYRFIYFVSDQPIRCYSLLYHADLEYTNKWVSTWCNG